MHVRQTAAVGILVLVTAVVAAPVVAFTAPAPPPQTTNGSTGEGSFGAQITSFMQASAADVNGSVEAGVWQASVDQSADPASEIKDRAEVLERRLESIQNRSEMLAAQRSNGTLSKVEYVARASALRGRIGALRSAIEKTDRTASRRGVNVTELDRLRAQAANATSPEVAGLARNISDPAGGPPAGVGNGPPDNRSTGPPEDRPDNGEGNQGNGPTGDRGTPSEDDVGRADPPDSEDRGNNDRDGRDSSDDDTGDEGDDQSNHRDRSNNGNGPPNDRGNGDDSSDDGDSDDSSDDGDSNDSSKGGNGDGPPGDGNGN